mmetsp:Transcript_386/g.779  ORF Transcript_386/g.779 Transcript_386/m.779 type:complete len:101 (-) Transcript_386:107-409(-)|eukprot:CAMPEP_0173203172 /NCGR_PEP_ID=MMETSP1141-20130122/19374_1 /TAXON_ID=483371 /ORGANISM="non described non described, Strain CCMP2298" /LENGTH=100 /DNA_ID=CAMNT_0014128605 /DNA_START=158 /DNA_END=460 /DNA_ORIENTATION=-
MRANMVALLALLVLSILAGARCGTSPAVGLRVASGKHLVPASMLLRGGAKKRPSVVTMFKSFWMTLVDPSKEEAPKKTPTDRKAKGRSSIKSKKGRSLKG